MAESILKLIPTNSDFIPRSHDMDKIRNVVSHIFPHASNINLHADENVRFIDPGANFHSVSCPFCASTIGLSWWQKAMDEAAVKNFSTLIVNTPCCNRSTSLNDLVYDWPAGFAKFVLTVVDPNGDLTDEDVRKIEEVLQCRVKKIVAHY